MYHGSLSCDSVLLRQDDNIKIGEPCHDISPSGAHSTAANIAESILERRILSPGKADIDTKCIGIVMMELMEPATSVLDPETTVLAAPEKWRDELGIKDFLAATQNSPLNTLKVAS